MATTVPFPNDYLHANKGSKVLATIVVFPTLALIIVSLRIYTRFKIVRNPSWEDFAIFLALMFSIATSICQGFQVQYGMGRHIQALTMEQGIGALKALFASIMMYNFGLTLTKVSILLQYLRITIDPPVKKACGAFIGFAFLNCFQTFFTGIFSCYPIAKFWDNRILGGCVNKPALWYANAAINIIQDVTLIVLPIFVLRKLVLPRREKISLVLVLGLGGFASLASVFRLHALYIVAVTQDITWDNPGTATWSAMELNIGIICGSLPTLRAFFAEYFPSTFSSSISGAHFTYQNSNQSGNRQLVGHRRHGSEGVIPIKSKAGADLERGKGTFLASDSELETPGLAQPLEMLQRLA